MNGIQFDPKITGDAPVSWRRQSPAQGSDMFADLLAEQMKRRSQANQDELAQQHKSSNPWDGASDPVSKRPTQIVLSHPKTISGEAKHVSHEPVLVKQSADPDSDAVETSDAAAEDASACPANSQVANESEKDTCAEEQSGAVDDAADGQDEQQDDGGQAQANPLAVVAVVALPTEQAPADVAAEAVTLDPQAPAIAPADEGATLPAPTEGEAATVESQPAAPTRGAKQASVEALAEASLTAIMTALGSGGDGIAADAAAPSATPQATAPEAAAATKQPALKIVQLAAEAADPAPAKAQPEIARPALDPKMRAAAPAQPQAAAPDASPKQGSAAQSNPTPVTTLLQPTNSGESAGSGDLFDQAWSDDNANPGWAIHLAQGAAAKRPDFVAQLKQHLQNLPAHEQVAIQIQRALREGTNKLSIQLSPAELGRIHVKLEIDEDKRVTAAVTVERPSTLELLQRDAKGLERALHDAGLKMDGGNLSFSLSQGSEQEFAQDLNGSAGSGSTVALADAGSETDQVESLPAQVMDTAAGVVNLQV